MVVGYFGLPGCGKSTFIARIAQQALKSGRYEKIFCNYYVDGTYRLDPDDLGRYDYSKCLILIDEITNIFDSRDFKKFKNYQREFWLLHRHYEVDIIYCTQQYDGVDKKIRDITEVLYHLKRIACFTFAKCIHRVLDVNNETKEIVYGYQIHSGLFGLICSLFVKGEYQLCFRPRYYKFFDSFERVKLPKKDFFLWKDVLAAQSILDEVPEDPTLLEQVTECIVSEDPDLLDVLPDCSKLDQLDQVLYSIQIHSLCKEYDAMGLYPLLMAALKIDKRYSDKEVEHD